MLPTTLDQYSRSALAGYTGFKPQSGAAAGPVLPAKGPTAETTTGFANEQVGFGCMVGYWPVHVYVFVDVLTLAGWLVPLLQVLRRGPQRVDHSHCINSRAGLMSFFTSKGESVSDNGLADAQRYFLCRRPYGGRMKHA